MDRRIIALLKEKEIDAVLVTDVYNMRYLSGFGGEGVLLLLPEEGVLITDSRYTIAARETDPEARGLSWP